MIAIIETNLSIDTTNTIKDFQSRVIEVESWNNYIQEIKECRTIERSSVLGNLYGVSISRESKVENLFYDDVHLSCDVINRFGFRTKKLVYRV